MVCNHYTIFKGMCCECGYDFQKSSQTSLLSGSVSMIHAIPDLLVSKEEARDIGENERKHLIDNKKLALVVDLDHTLVHSVSVDVFNYPDQNHIFPDGVELLQVVSEGKRLHICFRKNVKEFLTKISEYFEIHIFTLGTRDYADQVINHIDPSKQLIGDRIRTRTECTRPDSKHLELSKIFPVGEDMVCILDDRLDVWDFSQNIIQILPFYYVKSDPDIIKSHLFDTNFTLQTVEKIAKYCENAGYFTYISSWLKNLHDNYFLSFNRLSEKNNSDDVNENQFQKCLNENSQPDVKNILNMLRLQILEGVTLLFSGVIHDDIMSMRYLEHIATSMGAKIDDDIKPGSTTHILTPGRLTTKVKHCLSNPELYKLTHIDWLFACYYLGIRLPETDFPYNENEHATPISQEIPSVEPKNITAEKIDFDLPFHPRKRKSSDNVNHSVDKGSFKEILMKESSIFDEDSTLFDVIDDLKSDEDELDLDEDVLDLDEEAPYKISKLAERDDNQPQDPLIDKNDSEYEDITSDDLKQLEDALD